MQKKKFKITSKLFAVAWLITAFVAANLIQRNSFCSYVAPKDFIQQQIDSINAVYKNNSISEKEKADKLMKILVTSLDIQWMARFTIGTSWKDLNEEQKTMYTQLYSQYLLRIYSPYLADAAKNEMAITNVNNMNHGHYIVTVKIKTGAGKALNLDYRCVAKNDKSVKIRDISVANISMLSTQRTEFKAMIQRHGIDEFINILKSKL